MTVSELLRKCDSAELTEWQAFFRIREEEAKKQRLQAGAQANAQQAKQRLRRRR